MTVFRKAQGSVVSNEIGMKFVRIVLQVNKYALIDGVRFDVIYFGILCVNFHLNSHIACSLCFILIIVHSYFFVPAFSLSPY